MSQVEFNKALLTKFKGSGALDTALTSQFFDTQPPSDANGQALAELPFLVWTVIADIHPPKFAGDNLDVTLRVDLWSKKETGKEAATTNNDLIVALLNRQSLTMTGVTGITGRVEDRGTATFEGDAIRILSQYNFVGTGS